MDASRRDRLDTPLSPQLPTGKLGSVISRALLDAEAAEPRLSRDGAAERNADAVADRAVDKLGPQARLSPVYDGAVSPVLLSALARVQPGASLEAHIPVQTGATAQSQADSIGARAFSDGTSISVAAGELSDPVEANRLVAHEVAHTTHEGASLRSSGTVAAKLRGVSTALENQGGTKTSGKARRLVNARTNWDRILDGVAAYEAMEAAALKHGNVDPIQLAKITPSFIARLTKIEAACKAWEKANPDKPTRTQKLDEAGRASEDVRSKAARRQAINMLLPRIRLEMQDLRSGEWAKTMGLSDQHLVGTGKSNEGQKNPVQELMYATETGEFAGYFKQEKGFAGDIEEHEMEVGITQTDPNYGARSVAMYRIDQLLDANVTAKAEFAVHNGQLGTVLESAKGVLAADLKLGLTESHAKSLGPGIVSGEDPVLQKALNKLQILDAICGQLDRHQGNWYVQTDEKSGKVTGVTGIDLDMAFGSKMEDPDQLHGENYLGMTSLVDQEFGERVIKITPDDIRKAITGLLPQGEVDATVARYTRVRDKVSQMERDGQLTGTWGSKTALETRATTSTVRAGHHTYQSQLSGNAITASIATSSKDFEEMFAGEGPLDLPSRFRERLNDMPEPTKNVVVAHILNGVRSPMRRAMWAGTLPLQNVGALCVAATVTVLSNESALTHAEVTAQEATEGMYIALKPILEPVVDDAYNEALDRYKAG